MVRFAALTTAYNPDAPGAVRRTMQLSVKSPT